MEDIAAVTFKLSWEGEGVESTPLVQRVAEHIRELIMNGDLQPETQLPNEPEFSNILNVSRSTIRSALTILEQSGYVLRRRGIGTFVAKDPPAYNNLNVNSGVTQLIRSSGAAPGCTELLIATRPASEHVANRLAVEAGAPIVTIERVRLANERRVVFSMEYLPLSLFKIQDEKISVDQIREYIETHQSMYAFLRERLSMDIHHGMAWIRPQVAESYIAEKLQIPRGSSILYIEQVDYTGDGEPFALSDEYYVADAFTFSVYRSS